MNRAYRNANRQEISFPLGGIGTGSIGLDGTGRFIDWEIFNRPSKGSINGFSHFGIKAERDGQVVDARVMHADLMGSRIGRYVSTTAHIGYGYGPFRTLLCGVPHFRDSVFYGEFPLARIAFIDDSFPGAVSLEAFNPFIPSNDADSSIPAALFTASITNTTGETLDYTFEFSVNNPSPRPRRNEIVRLECFQGIRLGDNLQDADDPQYGAIAFGVPAGDPLQVQQYWYRGNWFDNLGVFWRDFASPGPLKNRQYPDDSPSHEDIATLAVRARVAPGQTHRQRFVLCWYYPNAMNYWSPAAEDPETEHQNRKPWKNYYAKLFPGAAEVGDYVLRHWDRLESDTRLFHDALFGSNLPDVALEAVSANISILKSPTVMRLPEGQFYGFEGSQNNSGSCEGSCTHVWNYAFALPFLYPNLERSMRELDYTYNLDENGGMPFRLQLPLGKKRSSFRPCVDGQMGGVIKTYREWKISGDDQWLRGLWPKVKKSLEFAWNPMNPEHWDPRGEGIISGRQHHTLDMELFGPNGWLNSFYNGALTAAAEMAEAMGDPDATRYREMAQRNRHYTDAELFNGQYYIQRVDIRDRDILVPYANDPALKGGTIMEAYWNEEARQIKYQIAEGCGIDQVLAQWMCELSGIGEILDPENVRQALRSIYRNNYKSSLRNHFNPCRVFGMNDESGAVICAWPEGVEKPVIPIPYAEETMHGFEYQVAGHMIMHGMEKEGLEIVRSIRNRYDGQYRNPWNEFECGSNYARSMASYGLLLAYSGFVFDMRRGRMGMLPLRDGRYFWSLDGCWGTMTTHDHGAELDILYGNLTLREWVLPRSSSVRALTLGDTPIAFSPARLALCLKEELRLVRGERLSAAY